jgi:hypothetical protein
MKRYVSVIILLLTLASGCVVAEEYAPGPPPDRVEVIGVAPFHDAIWIKGHWDWERGAHHYRWHEGYWRH